MKGGSAPFCLSQLVISEVRSVYMEQEERPDMTVPQWWRQMVKEISDLLGDTPEEEYEPGHDRVTARFKKVDLVGKFNLRGFKEAGLVGHQVSIDLGKLEKVDEHNERLIEYEEGEIYDFIEYAEEAHARDPHIINVVRILRRMIGSGTPELKVMSDFRKRIGEKGWDFHRDIAWKNVTAGRQEETVGSEVEDIVMDLMYVFSEINENYEKHMETLKRASAMARREIFGQDPKPDLNESSAGLPKSFGTDPVPQAKSGIKQMDKPKQNFPVLGGKYFSLVRNPREVVVTDMRKGVVYFHDANDEATHVGLPLEKFFKAYEPVDELYERSYRMGPVGPYIDSETGDSDLIDVEDGELLPKTIDLGASRRGNLDESFISQFGGLVKLAMHKMFGRPAPNILIRGTKSEVSAFGDVLSKEKRYLDSYFKNGLDDPKTLRSKGKLENSVRKFERETGLKWPFRD